MPLRSFKDLLVWQKADELSLDIYRSFANCRDYGFKDQVQRAGISVMNNIAEGYGRRSDKALINFLNIARGSAAEVESMIIHAHRLGYIDLKTSNKLLIQIDEIAKLLTSFIKKLRIDSESLTANR